MSALLIAALCFIVVAMALNLVVLLRAGHSASHAEIRSDEDPWVDITAFGDKERTSMHIGTGEVRTEPFGDGR